MMAGIAMVGLMGVVVNTAIVMVHTIKELSETKEISREIIIQGAVSRLRPILLTTVTTVLGVFPTGYGIGGFDPFLSHMSLVLGYGLIFSTGITLLLIPVFFMIGKDIQSNTVVNKLFSRVKIVR